MELIDTTKLMISKDYNDRFRLNIINLKLDEISYQK